MSTHFYPYDNEEPEQAPCGTYLGEASEITVSWTHVNCRLCLKRKAKIIAAHTAEESAIIEQMGDMAAYFKRAAGGQDE